jgi:hypothetical protein
MVVIPAEAGIQELSGFPIELGMTLAERFRGGEVDKDD